MELQQNRRGQCWRGCALLLAAACLGLAGTACAQESIAALHAGFEHPPASARPIMRWWWFGPSVTQPELRHELETMRSAGIGGVEIQPVYPLALDDPGKGIHNFRYLSPEFLGDIAFANQTARALGLRVDLTLGSGWPYGGPHTTLALAAGKLRVAAAPAQTPLAPPRLEEGESLIAAFLVQGTLHSFDPDTAQRIDPHAASLPAGAGKRTVLYFIASHTRQKVKRTAFGAEGYVLDHFARPAIDEHLTDVATPLLKAFGNQPPTSVFSDSLEVFGSDWTANLPAEFQRRRGYDLIPHLPELLAGGTPEAEAVRHDWGQTLAELVRDNYLAPLTQFAEAHGTEFRSQTYGEPAVTLADEATPNLPEGEGPQWRAFSLTRWASSASHLYGRPVTSAETWTWLHSPAFRATPLDMKAEADRMFLEGVNQIVGHGYPYSPPSAGEPGWSFYAAGAFNAHNPWFPVMPEVMHYLQRMSWLLRQGKPANDVAILLPEDDVQASFTLGHVSVTDAMKAYITPELMTAILDAGYNVDYIDAATINKLGVIPYPILIVPPTQRIPLATYRVIARYAQGKGTVIAFGELPSRAPGLLQQAESAQVAALSTQLFRASNHKGIRLDSIDELPQALHRALPPDLDATGKTQGLGFLHRKLLNSDVYFIVNTSNEPIDGSVHFRATGQFVQVWDPDNGAVLSAAQRSPGKAIQLNLAPYESRVFVIGSQPATSTPNSSEAHTTQLADLSSGWQIRFAGAAASQNLPALTSWTGMPGRQFYSGEADYTRSITLAEAPRPDEHLLDFGTGTPIADNRPPNAPGMHALLDPPIREAAIVLVNGKRAGALWHPPYRLDITALMRPGENRIEVRVWNTAINQLAGEPQRDYTALYARYGKRFEPQDMNDLRPVPSGLLGPIHLLAAHP